MCYRFHRFFHYIYIYISYIHFVVQEKGYIFVVDNFLIALIVFEICAFKRWNLLARGRERERAQRNVSVSMSAFLPLL